MNTSSHPSSSEAELSAPKESSEQLTKLAELTVEELSSITHPDITKAGVAVIDALKTSENIEEEKLRAAWVEYGRITEAFVDSIEESPDNPKARLKAQIAAIINKAYIFQLTGNTERYLEELDIAEVFAANEGLEDVRATLATEINNHIEQLPLTPEVLILKLKGVIEDDNREFLRDLANGGTDLEDLIGSAYGMILEEGGDPEEALASIGITE